MIFKKKALKIHARSKAKHWQGNLLLSSDYIWGIMFSYLSSYDSSPIILKLCVLHTQLESTQNLYSEIWWYIIYLFKSASFCKTLTSGQIPCVNTGRMCRLFCNSCWYSSFIYHLLLGTQNVWFSPPPL